MNLHIVQRLESYSPQSKKRKQHSNVKNKTSLWRPDIYEAALKASLNTFHGTGVWHLCEPERSINSSEWLRGNGNWGMADGSSAMDGGALLTYFLDWELEAGPRASPDPESQCWFADTQSDAASAFRLAYDAGSLTCVYSSDFFSHGHSRPHTT